MRGTRVVPEWEGTRPMREVRAFASSDGVRRLSVFVREDGRFLYILFERITEPLDYVDDRKVTGWTPALESGLHDTAEAAEREARATVGWIV